jgi:hypothetical protein
MGSKAVAFEYSVEPNLPDDPTKSTYYYTAARQEGQPIFSDEDLNIPFLCQIHKDQYVLDFDQWPICRKCQMAQMDE